MLSSFMKTKGGHSSSSSKRDVPVDSIHDTNVRPVHIIHDTKMDDIKTCQENVAAKDEAGNFDKVSLPTDSSLRQVPIQTVIVCNEEGNLLSGTDPPIGDEITPTMDQEEAKPKEVEENGVKNNEGDLSFDMDESILDGSAVDGFLRDFNGKKSDPREKERSGSELKVSSDEDIDANLHKSDDVSSLHQEDQEVHAFNDSAFVNLGQIMFSEQPDTQSEESSPSAIMCSHKIAPKYELLYEYANRVKGMSTLSKGVVLFKAMLVFFTVYGFTTFWFKMKGVDNGDEGKVHCSCAEESFHYAMYHLGLPTVDQSEAREVPTEVETSRFGTIFTALATIVLYHNALLLFDKSSKSETKFEKKQAFHGEGGQSTKRTKTTPKAEPKHKRELNSLDKKHVFVSTFQTEVVSPTGSITSVKRSSRVMSSCPKIAESKFEDSEVSPVKVDLLASFKMKPTGGRSLKMKTTPKAKAEKI